MRIVSLLVTLLALPGIAPAAAQAGPDGHELRVEPELQAEAAKAAAARDGPRAPRATRFSLPPTQPEELAELEAPRKSGVPLKIGIPRPITALQDEGVTGRALDWVRLEDGAHVAAVSITSPEAAGLRLGLRIIDVPDAAIFRFHDADESQLFEVGGETVRAAIAANAAAGDHGPDGRTYWSPVIESPTIVMEIELPPGTRTSALRMSIPRVSHLVATAVTDFAVTKAASACHRDATCDSATWGAQANAVARMVFSSGGSTFVCTGTLLADTDPATQIPYFLSAAHCIESQSEATSLATYWFWRSTACNSGVKGASVQLPGGAALLYRSTATDVAFMRLNSSPPAGAVYAGWLAGTRMALGAAATGLHHPAGDLLKISKGNVLGYLTCTAPGTGGTFSCAPASASAGTFYEVGWDSGITEGGSSGSALFDNGKYVVGQLYGGGSSCAAPAASDFYGRFDVSYGAGLSGWLNAPAAAPTHPLAVTRLGSGAGVVSSMPAGINCGSTCSAGYFQGTAVTLSAVATPPATFTGWGGACTGTGFCSVTMSGAVNVTATFTDPGVSTSPATLSFGAALQARTVTFTNDGGAAVTFLQASLTNARFAQANNCGVVAPGASCTATVTYHPDDSGADSGTLTLTSTAANSPHRVNLWGVPAAATPGARLANVSTRMQVATGNDVLIGGFVVGGATGKTVVVRARGPSLTAFGVPSALADPKLQLVRASDQSTVATNDDWGSAANAAQVFASGFAPVHSRESAILATLAPGAYTAIVSGAGGITGVGMVEVFEVDRPEAPLLNLSTRGHVLTGSDVMIGGFVIQGSGPQTVVVRARGPSLAPFGITTPLANPALQLVRSSDQATIATNDNWGAASNAAQLSASGLAPSEALEAAILVTLEPGAYTAIVTGTGNTTGVAIVEVFAQ